MTREEIEKSPETKRLKRTLRMYQKHILDYLIDHQPDEHVSNILRAGEGFLQDWIDQHADYLATDDEYYQQVAHRILEPVYVYISFRNGDDEAIEDERDKAIEERDKLAAALLQLKKEIRNYYGG